MTCGRGIWLSRRSHNHDRFPGMWQGAGGSIKPHETPIQGAVRELREETGIHVPESRLLPVAYDPRLPNGIGGWLSLYYFHVALESFEKPERTEPELHGPWKLFTRDQTIGLKVLEGLTHPCAGFWIARDDD